MNVEQCRSARALLNWSAAELATAAGIGSATVRRYESGQTVQQGSIATMRVALEQAGIVFIESGETSKRAGFGVRLAT